MPLDEGNLIYYRENYFGSGCQQNNNSNSSEIEDHEFVDSGNFKVSCNTHICMFFSYNLIYTSHEN